MEKNFDTIITKLGTGRWNIFYLITLPYTSLMIVYHALGGAFLAPRVPFTCRPPHHHLLAANTTTLSSLTNNSISNTENPCTYLVEYGSSGDPVEEPCTHWDFDNSTFSSTITSEFGLVCGLQYLQVAYQTLYMAGNMLGSVVSGLLSDKYGRKTVIVTCSVTFTVLAIGSCWLTNIYVLLASRFLLGSLHISFTQSSYTLLMEVMGPKLRSLAGMVFYIPWSLGVVAWGGYAYLIRDWRMLQLTVSLTGLLFLPVLLVIDESPRWLMVQGRPHEALKVVKKGARWNKVSLPPDQHLLQLLTQQTEEEKPVGDGDSLFSSLWANLRAAAILVRTPRLRTITFCSGLIYFAISMVYFGLSLSGGNYTSDPFLYMALTGAVEVLGAVSVPLVTRVSRKILVIVFVLLTGASLLCLAVIPTEMEWLIITLAMAGKFAINIAFNIIILFSTELFPTEVRNRGAGTCFMLSRLGVLVAPIVTDYLVLLHTWLPSVVLGTAAVVAGLITFTLPETLNTTLYDTVTQMEQQHHTAPDTITKLEQQHHTAPDTFSQMEQQLHTAPDTITKLEQQHHTASDTVTQL
ncbi:organic cation transporter protein isoform X2 [Procambarus clarkii]|uniref:organic cation transporter protein isoform X2 n=1 Tax=Procambarus clarkii TaxID=6728 RepID=UPI003744B23D